MKTIMSILICLTVFLSPMAAPADEKKEPPHCERLLLIIETAIIGIVKGDHNARLQVALDAHMRNGCDPKALLDALNIERPKPNKE